MRIRFVAAVPLVLVFASSAWAHYLWVSIETKQGKTSANAYFEEVPAPGDGEYNKHFIGTMKAWVRTVDKPEPKEISMKEFSSEDKKWLRGEFQQTSPRCIDCYGKFGVYRYGKTDVLLHYYARYLDVSSHEDLHVLGRAEQMNLELTPHDAGEDLELNVRWKGEFSPGNTVLIRGPEKFKKTLKTDDRGRIKFTPPHEGSYVFRTYVELNEAGKDGDDEYSLIRHHGTLIMKFPLEK